MSGDTFTHLGVYLGADAHIGCHTYPGRPDRRPILFVDSAGISLMIAAATSTTVSDLDLRNARALAEATATYLAEIERLHAAAPAEATPEEKTPKPGASAAAA